MSRFISLCPVILCLISYVLAAPHHPLVGVHTGHIGTGDINAQHLGNNVVNANDLDLHDILYDISKCIPISPWTLALINNALYQIRCTFKWQLATCYRWPPFTSLIRSLKEWRSSAEPVCIVVVVLHSEPLITHDEWRKVSIKSYILNHNIYLVKVVNREMNTTTRSVTNSMSFHFMKHCCQNDLIPMSGRETTGLPNHCNWSFHLYL